MKKNLFLAIFSIAFSTISWGQLQVFVPSGQSFVSPINVAIPNGDTVFVQGNSTNEMNLNLYVTNTSGTFTVVVNARRDSLNTPVALDNCFCWGGLCFPDSVTVAPPGYTVTLNPGETTSSLNEFNGHYFPYGNLGKAYIRYDFFNNSVPTNPDSAWVVVEYDAVPAGVQNISDNSIGFYAPYPNPANSSVNFSYSLAANVQSANLKIFNMLGKCVETLPLSALKSKTTIDVQAMPSGIYICEVEANGCQPAYQKLVVSH